MENWFGSTARYCSCQLGRAGSFIAAVLFVVIWLVSGPLFGWSDTWQLVANTVTTIITFLMVFLLQHTQNADTEAIQKKLDVVILALDKADNRFVGIEKENP